MLSFDGIARVTAVVVAVAVVLVVGEVVRFLLLFMVC